MMKDSATNSRKFIIYNWSNIINNAYPEQNYIKIKYLILIAEQ